MNKILKKLLKNRVGVHFISYCSNCGGKIECGELIELSELEELFQDYLVELGKTMDKSSNFMKEPIKISKSFKGRKIKK